MSELAPELPRNIQEFNTIVGLVFGQLYRAFPEVKDLDRLAVEKAMGIPESEGGEAEHSATHGLVVERPAIAESRPEQSGLSPSQAGRSKSCSGRQTPAGVDSRPHGPRCCCDCGARRGRRRDAALAQLRLAGRRALGSFDQYQDLPALFPPAGM